MLWPFALALVYAGVRCLSLGGRDVVECTSPMLGIAVYDIIVWNIRCGQETIRPRCRYFAFYFFVALRLRRELHVVFWNSNTLECVMPFARRTRQRVKVRCDRETYWAQRELGNNSYG